MTYDELLSADPTESEYMSRIILADIMTKEDWRCFSSSNYWGTANLIDRFLRSHARLKGLVSEEIYAELPATIIHCEADDNIVRGATFLNGAIVVSKLGNKVTKSLFVDTETAEKWGYPDNFIYLKDLSSE